MARTVKSKRISNAPLKKAALPQYKFNKLVLRPNAPLVITAYTQTSHLGNYYKAAVVRLVTSLIKFDMTYLVYPMVGVDNWIKGCSFKPTIILHALKKFNHPILWIDADGELFKYPKLFEDAKFDMALHSQSGHWLTGTLYFSPRAIPFVEAWKEKTLPPAPDEVALLHLYNNQKPNIRLELLPKAYNSVVSAKTDTSKLIVGHYYRPDIAPSRGEQCIPPAGWIK